MIYKRIRKRKSKSKLIVLGALIITANMILTGCGAKQIFKDANEGYELVAVDDSNLEVGKYYVKDTSKFYATYKPEANFTSVANIADTSRLMWTDDYDSLIPTMYQDGLIAYTSNQDVEMSEVTLERFEYACDSLGVFKAEMDIDGHIYIETQNIIAETSLAKALENEGAKGFTITEIDGNPVDKSMVGPGGVILGLEYGKTYKVSLYSGTYYKTINVKADRHFYRSYEMYKSDDITATKNGYLSINMPKDINSGYYLVNGAGLFRYYNVLKDEVNDSIDLNEAYYTNEADQIMAYSQAYMVNISQPTYDVEFNVTYETAGVDDEDIIAVLTAPDKTTYRMAAMDGYINTYLEYAIAGKWTINIVPQDLNVIDVTATSSAVGDDATVETYTFELEESSNQVFTVTYTGDGDVWGTVTYEGDGTATEFVSAKSADKEKNAMTATLTYVGAGTYTVNIYHYADTVIDEPTVSSDEDAMTDFNIVVESD